MASEFSSWIGKRVKLVFDSGSGKILIVHGKIIESSVLYLTIFDEESNSPQMIPHGRVIRVEGEEVGGVST